MEFILLSRFIFLLRAFIKISKENGIYFLFFLLFFTFLNSFFFFSQALSRGAYIQGGTSIKSMGGAGVASLDAYEGMLVNPVLIKYSKPRTAALFGNIQKSSKESLPLKNSFGLTLIDNSSGNHFPAGISFFRVQKEFEKEKRKLSEHYFHISFADVIFDRVIAGISVYYLNAKEQSPGEGNRSYKNINTVWAIHYAPFNQLALSLVHYNFFSMKKRKDFGLLHQLTLGMQYIPMDLLRIRFDVSYPMDLNSKDQLIYQMGLETFSNKLISLRVGSELNDFENKNFFTAGFSFNAPRFKLGFALKRNFKKKEKGLEYSVDLKFSF